MIPLLATSVAGLMAVVYKFLSLTESRIVPRRLSHEVANFKYHLASDGAQGLLEEFRIREIDLNPVIVHPEGEGILALDALMLVEG